ncbi:MAG: class I SAM-dependent methyltransferase [bacterium]|nr:class I SAM-dependent methyltransferase [bacterium]
MPDLKALNSQSWDDRLEARAHTYQLRGRFKFAHEQLVLYQPKKWLDIGTGNGFLPQVTRDKLSGVHITGTDFAENALGHAQGLDHKVHNDIDRDGLPFAAASFDFVTCLEVLEHLVFPEHALLEITRVLMPGGKVALTVPNIQHVEYLGQLVRGKMPGPAADARHMSVFTHKFIVKLFHQAGMKVIHPGGVDASPEWFAKISPKYLCKTIAVVGEKR